MTLPLVVLAVCTILLGVILTPAWPWLHSYLTGQTAHFNVMLLVQPILFVSVLLVGGGIVLGVWIYRKAGQEHRDRTAETDPLEHAQPALFRFLENKMWIDEIYASTVLAWSWLAARLSDWMDRYFWDGLVRGCGAIAQFFGILTTDIDERAFNSGVDQTTVGTRGLGRVISSWHSGQIQNYLCGIGVGVIALLILYAWLG
jgi:NADH-quinone oxidoreductase subunit L